MKNQLLVAALTLSSATAFALISPETRAVANRLGAVETIEVTFNAGTSTLSESQKKEIATSVNQQKQRGAIDRVDILAWSDKEYPQPNTEHAKADIDLATRRANEIKKYLTDTKTVSSAKTFNMAERPGRLEEALKTAQAKVKDSLEAGGAAPSAENQTGLFGQKGQANKALVLVYRK